MGVKQFLSTPSARRATAESAERETAGEFLSTPSARRATLFCCFSMPAHRHFYPRPPRGGRLLSAGFNLLFDDFYPRPPRGGRRGSITGLNFNDEFLSTPSARRATNAGQLIPFYVDISIHALREEGDGDNYTDTPNLSISIHALREEGDPASVGFAVAVFLFLSTPSARRAT